MSHPSLDLYVLTPSQSVLDLACIVSLQAQIEAAQTGGASMIAIDLSKIISQTPQGLAALVELGMKTPTAPLVICGLPRALMVCAIDLGMAELFPIYANAAALRSAVDEQKR
jgi:hypothetical protein